MDKERVIKVIAEHAGESPSSVKPETNLRDDLGMDSLDGWELKWVLEKESGASISDEEVEKWVTVEDVLASVTKATA